MDINGSMALMSGGNRGLGKAFVDTDLSASVDLPKVRREAEFMWGTPTGRSKGLPSPTELAAIR